RWHEMRSMVLEDIRNQDLRDSAPGRISKGVPAAPSARPVFSLPVFILLLFIFWPAAIIYAVSRYNK
ncbi:MAG TPA: hypothetical protein PKN50_20645, partial [Spirochaetota bacterium]|nr:hypothetical protein [Spirochaetota bacterium]